MTRDTAWAARPFWRYALIGSLAVHVALFALLAQVRISSGAREPQTLGKPIPIELFTPPKPEPVAVVRATPPPPPKPMPTVMPEPRRETAPEPAVVRPTPSRPSPPSANARPKPGNLSPPSGGGGRVGLGTLAPGGDLSVAPGAGSGGTPVGSVPGSGTGSGSGTGPGRGEGPAGTAEPKPNPGPPPPKPEPPKAEPKPPEHHSTLADRAMPELVQRVSPAYPLSAKEDGVEGIVQLRLRVETDGSASQVRVTKSSGDNRLDEAAVAAVRHWKYKPAVQNGVPRAVDTSASVSFRLE